MADDLAVHDAQNTGGPPALRQNLRWFKDQATIRVGRIR
jgi:hypothetical protein